MFKYLLPLIVLPCLSMASISSLTMTSTCRGLSGVPVVVTTTSPGDANCFDDPARVSLSGGFTEFGGGFIWLADTNLPLGQGEVSVDFSAEFIGLYRLTGGTGLVTIQDLFPVPPGGDINYHPALFLNGVPTGETLNVEFGVPFTVRAVFDHHETRTGNYGNFAHSRFDLTSQFVAVRQNGELIPANLRELVEDVPEPGSFILVTLGCIVLAICSTEASRNYRREKGRATLPLKSWLAALFPLRPRQYR